MSASAAFLSDTARLRVADVRAINARFAQPKEHDRVIGHRTIRIGREDLRLSAD